jgi:hypothetical protein
MAEGHGGFRIMTTTTQATKPLRAFHNRRALKRDLLAEIAKHEAADAIERGHYGDATLTLAEGWKGCAIGCALHSLNAIRRQPKASGRLRRVDAHERFPAELGIPLELAYHVDHIFEKLPDAKGHTWPRRVIDAMPVGADLTGVIPALCQWMILDPVDGFMAGAKTPAQQEILQRFAALVAQDWAGDVVTAAVWDALIVELETISARARARAGAYEKLSEQTIHLLQTAPQPTKVQR